MGDKPTRPVTVYDRDSNLWYEESSRPEPRTTNPIIPWLHQKRHIPETCNDRVEEPERLGTRSLVDQSLDAIAAHCDGIAVETLEGVPGRIAEMMWAKLKQRGIITPKLWQTFTTIFHQPGVKSSYGNCSDTSQIPETSLPQALPYLASPSFAWTCIMSLFAVNLSRADWMRLGSLDNLGALMVSDPHGLGNFCEKVVHGWGCNAHDHGAFTNLRLLMLDRLDLPLTICLKALKSLEKLKAVYLDPRLATAATSGSLEEGAEGWNHAKEQSGLLMELGKAREKLKEPLTRRSIAIYYNIICRALNDGSHLQPVLNVRTGSDRSIYKPFRHQGIWIERVTQDTKIEHDADKKRVREDEKMVLANQPKIPRLRGRRKRDDFDGLSFVNYAWPVDM